MCRHLAYIGPPVALRSLLFDAPHALVHQARTPRFQHAGPDNPDGWGVAWGSDPSERYRTAIPMWDDVAFAGPERAGGVLAAARYATRGLDARRPQLGTVRLRRVDVLAQRLRLGFP